MTIATTYNPLWRGLLLSLLIPLILLIFQCELYAAPAGTLIHHIGIELSDNSGATSAIPVSRLQEKSTITTAEGGSSALILDDETLLRIDENSSLTLHSVDSSDSLLTHLKLNRGRIWLLNKRPSANVLISTPRAEIGIRGTELAVQYHPDGSTHITALEGESEVRNQHGSLILTPGEVAVVDPDSSPSKHFTLTPQHAVQWTVIVPHLASASLLDRASDPAVAQQIWGQIMERRLTDALEQLQPHENGNDGVMLLLLALTSLLTGDQTTALQVSERAIQLLPDHTDGWIIRGTILQASFQLEQAEISYRKALSYSPHHPVAQLYLAQILFGGEQSGAAKEILGQTSATRDAQLLAKRSTLRGFIALAERDDHTAQTFFRQARGEDPSLATPRLGMGLLHARQGNEAAAQAALSNAILLEPRRAMYRNYWAKILYQTGRLQEALEVLDVSQNIDPNDPTPYLYRALILRDLQQPVQSIDALHHAVKLNDNRAIFRSRSLLDRDLAVKNSNLALLYEQLGLNEWAQIRATRSVEEDFTNPAAHLFLANSLSASGNQSYVENSEHLLARLMQPANNNTFSSFNDYATLLEQPSVEQSLELSLGDHGTRFQQWRTSGYSPQHNLAWQSAVVHDSTDGWDDVKGEEANGAIGYLKWERSPTQSLMGVVSLSNDREQGRSYPRYEIDAPQQPSAYQFSQIRRLELGLHQRLHADQHLLLHLGCFNNQFQGAQVFDANTDYLFDQQRPHCQLQGRWMEKDQGWQRSIGLLHYRGEESNRWELSSGTLAGDPDTTLSASTLFINQQYRLTPKLLVEGDLHLELMQNSNTTLNGAEWDLDAVNPSFGIRYQFSPKQTLRLARMETLTPLYSGSGRLDTQTIVGLPALRNRAAGTEATEWVVRWEQEWEHDFFSAEWFDRKQHHTLHYSEDDTITEHHLTHQGEYRGYQLSYATMIREFAAFTAGYQQLQLSDEANPDAERDDQLLDLAFNWQLESRYSGQLQQRIRKMDSADPSRPDETITLTHLELSYALSQKRGKLSLQVDNLFDRAFNWVNSPFDRTGEAPQRLLQLKLLLNL